MSPPGPAPALRSSHRASVWAGLVLAVQLVFALWAVTRAWDAPLLDRHEYRQAQTALTVYWIEQDGFSPAYPLPLFGPPWSAPMEFPLYQGLVAAWKSAFGGTIETSGRAISALMLLAALPAVWLLGRGLDWGRPTRLLALAAVLSAPVHLFYARTVMIETTALCLSVWFLGTYVGALRGGGPVRVALAAAFAILAGLAKATTWLVFLVPALALAVRHLWPADRPAAGRSPIRAGAPVAAGLIATGTWVAWGDTVKRSNPLADFLVSSNLREWNYGRWAQRVEPELWLSIWGHTGHFILAIPALAVLAVLAPLIPRPARRQALLLAAAFVAGVLIFPNLFFVHDYYYCANALLLMLAAARVLGGVWESPAVPRSVRVAATLIFLGGQWSIYATGYSRILRDAPTAPPVMAEVIQAAVPPEDAVLIYGADWGALLPYYSQRRAIMVRSGHEEEMDDLARVLDDLPPRRMAAMLVQGPLAHNADFLRSRIERFGLGGVPLAEDADGALYLAEPLLPAAEAGLQRRRLPGVTLNLPAPVVATDLPEQEIPAGFPLSNAVPGPARGVAPFEVVEDEAGPVLFVHAPAALTFHVPPHATSIEVQGGLLPGSYAADADSSDGIEIIVAEKFPNGLHRVLIRRMLHPTENRQDRGTQLLRVDLERPIASPEIEVRITSGPADNTYRDWAYLARVHIR